MHVLFIVYKAPVVRRALSFPRFAGRGLTGVGKAAGFPLGRGSSAPLAPLVQKDLPETPAVGAPEEELKPEAAR